MDIVLSNSEISEIMHLYGISFWSQLQRINQGGKSILDNNNSGTSRKVFLDISGQSYILKEIPWYCSERDFVEASTKFQKALFERGVCIPHIIAAQTGDDFVELTKKIFDHSFFKGYSHSFFVLQEIANGVVWSGSSIQVRGLSEFLGLIHTASLNIDYQNSGINLPHESVFSIVLNMLGFAEEEIREKNPGISKSEIDNLSDLLASFEQKTHNLIAHEPLYSQIKMGVHGDYNPTNMLFRENGEVAAIFDFDNAAMDNPVHDLAQAILHTSFFPFREGTSKLGAIPDNFDKEQAKFIFQTYVDAAPFEELYLKSLLPGAIQAVSMELVILGLLTSSYELSEIYRLKDIPAIAEAAIKATLEDITSKKDSRMERSP